MDAKTRSVLEKSAATIDSLLGEVKKLRIKEANFNRLVLAEDIALMKAAAGVISFDDLLDERDKLNESDSDLSAVKLAMQQFGPGKTTVSTVSAEAITETNQAKTASSEPDYLVEARLALEKVSNSL